MALASSAVGRHRELSGERRQRRSRCERQRRPPRRRRAVTAHDARRRTRRAACRATISSPSSTTMPASSRCSGSIAVRTACQLIARSGALRRRSAGPRASHLRGRSATASRCGRWSPAAGTAAPRARSCSSARRGRGRARRRRRRSRPRIALLAQVEVRERLVRRLRRAEQEALREATACRARPARRRRRRSRPARADSVTPAAYCGQAAPKAPSSTRNSPVKPLVVGSPIDGERQDREEHRIHRQQLRETAVRRELAACGSARRSCRPSGTARRRRARGSPSGSPRPGCRCRSRLTSPSIT